MKGKGLDELRAVLLGPKGWCGWQWSTKARGGSLHGTGHTCKLAKRHRGRHRCLGSKFTGQPCRSYRERAR